MGVFIVVAVVLTIFAVAVLVIPILRTSQGISAAIAASVIAVTVPAAVLLIYVGTSNYDWNEAPTQATAPPAATDMAAAVAGLEARLKSQPDDAEGWMLLGASYIQMQRYTDAQAAFSTALTLSDGENNTAKLGVAEAEIFIDRSAITGEAGDAIEEVVAAEPNNPKALWYAGMVALARNEPGKVRQHWQKLLEFSPPDSVVQIINQQLADLDSGTPETGASPGISTATTVGIDVKVSVAAELADQVGEGAILFVVAREPNRAGPPIAAVRHQALQLPLLVRITDANVMLPGGSISNSNELRLIARVANGGDALAQPGDIFGEARWLADANPGDPVSIIIDQVVKD